MNYQHKSLIGIVASLSLAVGLSGCSVRTPSTIITTRVQPPYENKSSQNESCDDTALLASVDVLKGMYHNLDAFLTAEETCMQSAVSKGGSEDDAFLACVDGERGAEVYGGLMQELSKYDAWEGCSADARAAFMEVFSAIIARTAVEDPWEGYSPQVR